MPARRTQIKLQELYCGHCEQMPDGNLCVNLPDALVAKLFWQIDDQIEWSMSRGGNAWAVTNISVRTLYVARFRRDLNSLINALNNPKNPLLRAVIKSRPGRKSSVLVIAEPPYRSTQRNASKS